MQYYVNCYYHDVKPHIITENKRYHSNDNGNETQIFPIIFMPPIIDDYIPF